MCRASAREECHVGIWHTSQHGWDTIRDYQSPRAKPVPYTYAIDHERQLVVSTGSGVLTTADIVAHIDRLRSDPNFDPGFRQLMDFTQVTEAQLPSDEIRRLAQITLFSSRSQRAIVVGSSPFFYGLARMYEMSLHSSGTDGAWTHVFEDLDSAKQWLGLDDPPIETN